MLFPNSILPTNRKITYFGVCLGCLSLVVFIGLIQLKIILIDQATDVNLPQETFPLGVNPQTESIKEQPIVEEYFTEKLHPKNKSGLTASVWFAAASKELVNNSWFQNLATPLSRTLVIYPGERKEQVVDNIGDILNWNDDDRELFSILVSESLPSLPEGKFFPGHYIVEKDATPLQVARQITGRLQTELLSRYTKEIVSQISLSDTLIIASMIEREAADFTDMRYISGIIWNRLFSDMRLQLDATLQYVKASNPTEPNWWPKVNPRDKFISSPFNTYENAGLPPAPISNPSLAAILATLNPRQTSCLFYFHDDEKAFHCSDTYEEHVEKLKAHYGQGR